MERTGYILARRMYLASPVSCTVLLRRTTTATVLLIGRFFIASINLMSLMRQWQHFDVLEMFKHVLKNRLERLYGQT